MNNRSRHVLKGTESMNFQCSADESNSKTYTISTDNVVDGSKIFCSGQIRGFVLNQGVSNNESKTHITQIVNSGSIIQNSGQAQQLGTIHNQGFIAQTNRHTNTLIEKKQKSLFTEKQIGDRNERRITRAKFRSYSKLTIRKQSFIGWTSECMLPIWNFAMAGFFYKGK